MYIYIYKHYTHTYIYIYIYTNITDDVVMAMTAIYCPIHRKYFPISSTVELTTPVG